MDRLKKAARAAGFVMAGLESDQTDTDTVAPEAHVALPAPVMARPLMLAAPPKASSVAPSLWGWIGGFTRGAPA